jgi:leucyl-tRNA synthetase
MILGLSAIIFRDNASGKFVSADLSDEKELQPVYIDTKFVDEHNVVDIERLRSWRKDFAEAKFQLNAGVFLCRRLTEKMSKSKHNVISPDDVIAKYGADCFRLHEMFLGPIDQTMTWSTDTIEVPFLFLSRLWRLFYNDSGELMVVDDMPSAASQALINNTIISVSNQTAELSFNTAIATMMSCVKELTKNAIFNSIILEKLLLILHPFAPFITSELWQRALRKQSDITLGPYPSAVSISTSEMNLLPVAINGKTRFYIHTPQGAHAKSVQALVMSDENSKKWLVVPAKRVIFIPGKIINFILDPQ